MRVVDELLAAVLGKRLPQGVDRLLWRLLGAGAVRAGLALVLLREGLGLWVQSGPDQVSEVVLLGSTRGRLLGKLLMPSALDILVVASGVLAAYASAWSP